MIIKRKTGKKSEIPREEIVDFQQGADDIIEEAPEVVEEVFDAEDFDMNPPVNSEPVIEQIVEIEKTPEPEEVDLFNLENVDFQQRQERRRGDRRRGYRRGDDRNLISRAREEADSIKEAASKEGYQEGLSRAAGDIIEIKDRIKEFLKAPQEVFEYIAPDILEISLEIAQKIIKNEVTQNPQILIDKITEILKTLSKEEPKVTIRVNPNQVSIAKQHIPEILDNAGIETKVVILTDESVTEGGCIVSTNNGVIDAIEWIPKLLCLRYKDSPEAVWINKNILQPLKEYDSKYHYNLLGTLDAIFNTQTLEEAAKKLFIHINTIYYRIKKIEEITGKNLNVYTDRYLLMQASFMNTVD